MPAPTATLIAATTQSEAAVEPANVDPVLGDRARTEEADPETTYDATRDGSTTTPMSLPSS